MPGADACNRKLRSQSRTLPPPVADLLSDTFGAASALSSPYILQTKPVVLPAELGNTSGAGLGSAAAFIPKLSTGDGLAVGSPGQGRVYILYPSGTGASWNATTMRAEDIASELAGFGSALSFAPGAAGTGVLAVGAPATNESSGAVVVAFVSPTAEVSRVRLLQLHSAPGDEAGASASVVPSFEGRAGVFDLLVGLPGARNEEGVVLHLVLSGEQLDAAGASVTISASVPAAGARFGAALASAAWAGATWDNVLPERLLLAVGAPGHSGGAFWLIRLDTDAPAQGTELGSVTGPQLGASLGEGNTVERTGAALSFMGTVQQSGKVQMAVTIRSRVTGGTRVVLTTLATDNSESPNDLLEAASPFVSDSVAPVALPWEHARTLSLAAQPGHVAGAAFNLLVGVPCNASNSPAGCGRIDWAAVAASTSARVTAQKPASFAGGEVSFATYTVVTPHTQTSFGHLGGVAYMGDWDGDGNGDIVVGATHISAHVTLSGGAFVVLLDEDGSWSQPGQWGAGTRSVLFTNGEGGFATDSFAANSYAGFGLAAGIDLDGNGVSDMVMCSSRMSSAVSTAAQPSRAENAGQRLASHPPWLALQTTIAVVPPTPAAIVLVRARACLSRRVLRTRARSASCSSAG